MGNDTMKTKITLTLTILALAAGCAAQDQPSDAFRVLPVSALAQDGRAVLVGTYDEESREIELVPAFVDEVGAVAEGDLHMVAGELSQPLAVLAVWDAPLAEGSTIDLVVDHGDEPVAGGRLVVHAEDWTDGLTEAEAASSFAACFDPDCAWWDFFCDGSDAPQA